MGVLALICGLVDLILLNWFLCVIFVFPAGVECAIFVLCLGLGLCNDGLSGCLGLMFLSFSYVIFHSAISLDCLFSFLCLLRCLLWVAILL